MHSIRRNKTDRTEMLFYLRALTFVLLIESAKVSRAGGLRHPRVVPPLGDARNVSIVVRMSTYFVRKLDADIFLEFWLSRFCGFGHGFCCAHAWNSKNLCGFCSMTAYFCPSHLIKHMHSIRRIAQKCCFTKARALLFSLSPDKNTCIL